MSPGGLKRDKGENSGTRGLFRTTCPITTEQGLHKSYTNKKCVTSLLCGTGDGVRSLVLSKCSSVPELHIQSFVSEWEESSRKG